MPRERLGLVVGARAHTHTHISGFEIEPRFISSEEASLFEVHHVDDDVKFCVSDALHVLHKEYHRSLRRRRA